MAEKEIDVILPIIGGDSTIIPYRKELALLTGSSNSAILLGQIIYWYEKVGRRPFFKYKEPPQKQKGESQEEYLKRVKPYKEGDSWCEELCFTRKEFDGAISRIAKQKNEDADFQKEFDKADKRTKVDLTNKREKQNYQHPLRNCIVYWTDRDRKTWYHIQDPDTLAKVISVLYLKYKRDFRKRTKDTLDIIQRLLTETTTTTTEVVVNTLACVVENLDLPPGDNPDIPTKSEELRQLSKEQKQLETPDLYKCPSTVKPFIDMWEQYTGRKYGKFDKKSAYAKDCRAIFSAIHGRFFNKGKTPDLSQDYYDCSITIDDWKFALERFSLIRNNSNYSPEDKQNIKRISAKLFLYNPYTIADSKSYFITCLESEPKLISASVKTKSIPDLNPELTDSVIEKCKQVFGWDMNNGKRHLAIQTVNRLNSFFETEKPKILHYDIHYRFFNQRLDALVKMLEANESPEYPAQPSYLCGNITYNDRLPKYLKEVRAYRT